VLFVIASAARLPLVDFLGTIAFVGKKERERDKKRYVCVCRWRDRK